MSRFEQTEANSTSLEKHPASTICCEDCGLIVSIPELHEGHQGNCPRCQSRLMLVVRASSQRIFAYGITCLILLTLSLTSPFLAFNLRGIKQEIHLLDAAHRLNQFTNSPLAIMLLLAVIILPAIYISIVMFLQFHASRKKDIKWRVWPILSNRLCRMIFLIQPWLMADVFLIGVLVSCIKMSSLAELTFGPSFWVFCGYAVLMVKFSSLVDRASFWGYLVPMVALSKEELTRPVKGCPMCLQVNSADKSTHCIRCQCRLHDKVPQHDKQKAWAFLFASIIFYVPANLYPMMYIHKLGQSSGSTILGGIRLLWSLGSYPVAIIIFLASIMIPITKMVILARLLLHSYGNQPLNHTQAKWRLTLYHATEVIGRWSMIDVFVVAILTALVQLQQVIMIYPGPAVLFFAMVVVFTMLSAMAFDPKIFWHESDTSLLESSHNKWLTKTTSHSLN